jgi:peptide-methionine (R)-S-oxide reductase
LSSQPHYERRAFLLIALAGSGAYAWWSKHPGSAAVPTRTRVRIAEFNAQSVLTSVADVDIIRRSAAEWQKQLPPDSYAITRQRDTEFAGTGAYDRFYADGIYRCICCGTALFDSKSKYASGTGWPSFTEPIAKENVVHVDSTSLFGIREIEARCTRCDAHLGHVFDDGPPLGNLRYCINSVALRFVARTT